MISFRSRILSFLVLAFALGGCDVLSGDSDKDSSVGTVIVANGGNFSDQNGHLTTFDIESGQVVNHPDLGGFLQGLLMADRSVYTFLNTFGEGRIDVLDESTLAVIRQITPVAGPRDAALRDGTLWVSSFTYGSAGAVVPINLSTGLPGTPVQVGDVPEGIVVLNEKVIVANSGSLGAGSTLSVINAMTHEVEETVDVACDGPRDLYVDHAQLIVVCTGKTVYNADFSQIIEKTNGQVIFLDQSFAPVARILLEDQASSTNGTETAFYSDSTDELFVTLSSAEKIIIVDISSRALTGSIDVPNTESLIGISGIAYDRGLDRVFVGRFPVSSSGPFPDYTSAGTVQIIMRDGTVDGSFTAGTAISSIQIN